MFITYLVQAQSFPEDRLKESRMKRMKRSYRMNNFLAHLKILLSNDILSLKEIKDNVSLEKLLGILINLCRLVDQFETKYPGKSLNVCIDSQGLLVLNGEIIICYRKIEEMDVFYKSDLFKLFHLISNYKKSENWLENIVLNGDLEKLINLRKSKSHRLRFEAMRENAIETFKKILLEFDVNADSLKIKRKRKKSEFLKNFELIYEENLRHNDKDRIIDVLNTIEYNIGYPEIIADSLNYAFENKWSTCSELIDTIEFAISALSKYGENYQELRYKNIENFEEKKPPNQMDREDCPTENLKTFLKDTIWYKTIKEIGGVADFLILEKLLIHKQVDSFCKEDCVVKNSKSFIGFLTTVSFMYHYLKHGKKCFPTGIKDYINFLVNFMENSYYTRAWSQNGEGEVYKLYGKFEENVKVNWLLIIGKMFNGHTCIKTFLKVKKKKDEKEIVDKQVRDPCSKKGKKKNLKYLRNKSKRYCNSYFEWFNSNFQIV